MAITPPGHILELKLGGSGFGVGTGPPHYATGRYVSGDIFVHDYASILLLSVKSFCVDHEDVMC